MAVMAGVISSNYNRNQNFYAYSSSSVTFQYGTKKFKLTAEADLSEIKIEGNTVSGNVLGNVAIKIQVVLSLTLYSSASFTNGTSYPSRWYYTYPEGADTIAMTINGLNTGDIDMVHWTFTPGCYDSRTPEHDYTIVKNVDGIMRRYCVDTSGYGYNIQVAMADVSVNVSAHIQMEA
jgi:hypothetical protein